MPLTTRLSLRPAVPSSSKGGISRPVIFRRGGVEVRPFTVMRAIAKGEAGATEWTEVHANTGISNRPLASG
jgi:hypothetical protein